MLLLSALVQHLKLQRSPLNAPKPLENITTVEPQIDAATLARTLTEKPKLMIELAIELTKLAQNDYQQTTNGAAQVTSESAATEAAGPQKDGLQGILSASRVLTQSQAPGEKPDSIPGQPSLSAGRLI